MLNWVDYWFFWLLALLMAAPPGLIPLIVVASYAFVFAAGYFTGIIVLARRSR